MPPVLWSLIPTATPVSRVPMPSVTTIDSTRTTTTKKALIAPTSSPAPSATRIDGMIDHPWITFSQPTSTSESPITPAIETSNSPTASGTISPSVRITSTACEPAIVCTLPNVKNVSGRMIEKTTITASQTTRMP